MKKYYKFLIAILFFFSITGFLFFISCKPVLAPESRSDYKTEEIKIGENIIKVEIADTLEKQEKGLSGRQSMGGDQGMIFIFNSPDHYSFWMKDMKFSLDFIWINGNEIVEITRNVKPGDYQPASTQTNRGEPPKALVSKEKIDKILEVNAGVADRLGIKEGDKISF